ncbi:MAG: CoB--CoM heterodisulfide reductase iron-sulfur subunit A family protein [Magnetococcales bacterium]|nr:CoB--CoM heterodisulfide reductase iron-sulfur subunit A family protein [Magnetococcales bacterium]MBF0150489.1 CoB--CoM heterodisulfide reductase iron-sulfur subunit A family protein [Magnetococcales bacterium]MBF0173646.1 CoB--CoM heterodisulfide reductase iron-sulfur subunit A family protein [Magnetococcales bacterium]
MADGQAAGQTILVVGGGISGLTTAVEAAEVGYNVLLVEKSPHFGGRVAQHTKYFPKLCSPTCGLEINYQRIKNNPRIRLMTLAEVLEITGSTGAFTAKIRQNPRFVNQKCTACGDCAKACQTEVANPYNFGMNKVKAIRHDHFMAFPSHYYMDPDFAATDEAKKLVEVCPVGAIEPGMQAVITEEKVASVVWTTGWKPYDAEKILPYGFGRFANVTTNMRLERMADRFGPTGGRIIRPSDGKEAKNVAFIQCAGSRDHNYLPFCSRICCLASMKQATYVRGMYPDSTVTIFYIDLRAMDRYESFQKMVESDPQVRWIKSKPARIDEDPKTGNPIVVGENTLTGVRYEEPFDLVVLATGMEPNSASDAKVPMSNARYDEYGFVVSGGGLFSSGCSSQPSDVSGSVQSSTASALRAIQTAVNAKG